MKRRKFSLIPTWLRRRPKMTYVVCPSCQRQAVNGPSQPAVDPTHQRVAEQAFDAVAGIDALRRQKAAGDPIRNQLLADIEAGFIQNVANVGYRLRRDQGWEGRS